MIFFVRCSKRHAIAPWAGSKEVRARLAEARQGLEIGTHADQTIRAHLDPEHMDGVARGVTPNARSGAKSVERAYRPRRVELDPGLAVGQQGVRETQRRVLPRIIDKDP